MNEESTTKPKYTKTLAMISNKPGGKEYKITIPNKLYWVIVLTICVLVGIVFGFLIFGSMEMVQITNEKMLQHQEYLNLKDQHAQLKFQYEELVLTNGSLSEQVQVLSDTINKRTMEDEAAALSEAEKRLPAGFPVTGSVTEADAPKDDPNSEKAVYYKAAENSIVVATGTGVVTSVRENAYEKYEVSIDHGNEYVTLFVYDGYPLIEEGVEVLKGTPLFFIQDKDALVKYQIYFQGELKEVYDVMNIAG